MTRRPKAKRRQNLLRRALEVSVTTLLAFTVLLLLVAAPPRFLEPLIQPLRALLVSVATGVASQSLNGALEIDLVEGSLFSAPVVRGIRLTDAQGEQVVRIDTLSLRYRLADLFEGRLRIEELTITRPKLQLAWDEQEQLNLIGMFQPASSEADATSGDAGKPIPITLERVMVRYGSVQLLVPSLPGVREIEDLSLDLSGQIGEDGLHLALQGGVAQAKPAAVGLEALQGTLTMTDGRLQLGPWLIETDASQIGLEGSMPGDSHPTNLQLDVAPLDVGEMGRLLGEPALQGEIRGVVQAQGPVELLELDGRFTTGTGEIVFSGTLDTLGPLPKYQSTLQLTQVDLADLIARDAFRSDLNAKVELQGAGLSKSDLVGELAFFVEPSRIGDVTVEPSGVRITAESQRLRVETFQLQTSAFTAALEGDIDLDGRSELDYQVTVELEKIRGLVGVHTLAGQAQLRGQVLGSWPDTYVDGRLEASAIVVDEMGVQGLDLHYHVGDLHSGAAVAARFDARGAAVGGIEIEAVTGDAKYAFREDKHRGTFTARLIQSATVDAALEGAVVSDGQRSELTLEHLGTRLKDHLWNNATPFRLTFTPDSLLIEPFRMVHSDESIALSGALRGRHLQDLVFRASNIDLTFLGRISAMPALVTGRGDLALDLNGTLEAPVLKAAMTLRADHDQGPLFEQAGIHMSYAQERLESEVYVTQEGRQILAAELELPINLALDSTPVNQRIVDAPLTGRLNIDRPRLDALSTSLPDIPPIAGTLQGQINVGGTYTKLAIDALIDLERTTFPEAELAVIANLTKERLQLERISAAFGASEIHGEGEIAVDDQRMALEWQIPRLELGELVADWPDGVPSRVSGKADLAGTATDPVLSTWLDYAGAAIRANLKLGLGDHPPGYEGDLRISGLDLARIVPDLRGSVNASAAIQGNGFSEDDREAQLSVAIDSKDFGLAPGVTVQLNADLIGRTVQVDALRVQSTPFEIQAQGALSKDQASDFGYRLTVRDLAPLHEYGLSDLELRGELRGKISGGPDALRNVSTLEVEEWRYADWEGGEVNGKLEIDDLLGTLRATASADIKGLQGPQLATTALRLDGAYWKDQGELSLAATEGPFARSLIAGQIQANPGLRVNLEPFRLQQDEWLWENEGPIRFTADSTGRLSINNLNLVSRDQRISAQGAWSADGTIAGEAVVDGLQLRPLVDALAPAMGELDGLVDADFTVGGTMERPQIDAALKTTALRYRQQDLGEIHARLSTAGTIWTGSGRWVDQEKALLSVDGRLDRSASDEIAVDVRAPDLDLSRLQHLSPEILHSDGRLRLDLELSGTPSHPQARGTMDLEDGELRLAALGTDYTDIQSRWRFKGGRADIEQLQVRSPTGIAELHGWMEVAGLALGQVDLNLDADRFTVSETPALAAVISSDVRLHGSSEDLMASGKVEVVRARLRYEALPSSGPAAVEPWELTVEGVFGAGERQTSDDISAQPRRGSPPLLPFLRTDLQVRMPGNNWVQGTGTAVEIGGDVRVIKALGRPFTVAGKLRALRGFASFFGSRFTVEKGEIRFTGSEEIDPILDIEASHKVSGYTAYVRVTGKASKPEVSFRSDPELGESDIISLLVFGRTSDQLSSSERNSLGNQARSLAGRLAAGVLERSVGDSLGLDSIAIETGDDTTATSVGAGRYIGQGLFLFYERTFRDPRRGNRSGNAVGIEKRLNQRQKLKATGSDLGETSVDWLWQYDY